MTSKRRAFIMIAEGSERAPMKIHSDVINRAIESRVVSNPVARKNASVEADINASGPPAGPSLGWVSERRAGEHSVSEALSIAQMAQHVLQKAMEISSRLRNMAMDAMAARPVDYREIAAASAELSAAMGEYAGRFGAEALPPAAIGPKYGAEGVRPASENLGAAIKEISSFASDLGEGRAVELSRIESLRSRLENGLAENERAVTGLTKQGLDMAREYTGVGGTSEAGGLRIALLEAIGRDSKTALLAQGNISRDTAAVLLDA